MRSVNDEQKIQKDVFKDLLRGIRKDIANAIGKNDPSSASIHIQRLTELKNKTNLPQCEDLLNDALKESLSSSNHKIAMLLLENGANPKSYDNLSIRLASSKALHEILPKIIEKGGDPTIADSTPLCLAAGRLSQSSEDIEDNIKTIKVLMSHISKLEQDVNKLGIPRAIHSACWAGNTKIAETILEYLKTEDIIKMIKDSQFPETASKISEAVIKKRCSKLLSNSKNPNALEI